VSSVVAGGAESRTPSPLSRRVLLEHRIAPPVPDSGVQRAFLDNPEMKNASDHPRDDARQSHKSISQIYREFDGKSQFPLPLTQSMAPTDEPNCSSKNLGYQEEVHFALPPGGPRS